MSIPFTLQWYCEVEQQDIGYQDLFKVVRYHCSVTDITITAVWSKTETKIEHHRFHWFKCIPVNLGPDFFSCRIAPQVFKTNNQTNRYKKIGICRQNQTGPNFFSLAMPWLRSLKSCLASFFLFQSSQLKS